MDKLKMKASTANEWKDTSNLSLIRTKNFLSEIRNREVQSYNAIKNMYDLWRVLKKPKQAII